MGVAPGALRLAAVWLGPAGLLAAVEGLLADGTRGLFYPAALAVAAAGAAVLLGPPWGRLPPPSGSPLAALLQRRFGGAAGADPLLGLGEAAVAGLFVAAQLAAVGQVAAVLGAPRRTAVGLAAAVAGLAAIRPVLGARLAAAGGAALLAGLLLPLAVLAHATDPLWPRVFAETAGRARPVFAGDGPWTREGAPVRGPGPRVELQVVESQRLLLRDAGPVQVRFWEGGEWRRTVDADTELTLRPGDRLLVPEGARIRFQAGRPIPGAPASGAEWLDPRGARAGGGALAGLGLTLGLGGLGLPPVLAAVARGRRDGDRVARLGALLGLSGILGVIGWGLYAAWRVPEVYAGGVLSAEVFEMPTHLAELGPWGPTLGEVALGGLLVGGIGSGLAALLALPRPRERGGAVVLAVAGAAGLLAALAGASAQGLLLAAFGLAAAVCAPAAVLGAWAERPVPRGLRAGAAAGLLVYALLTALAATPLAPSAVPGLAWLVAWPGVPGAALNALAVRLLAAPRSAAARVHLDPGLAALHD